MVKRIDDHYDKFINYKDKRKRNASAVNEPIRKLITWAPLLVGKVAYGVPSNKYVKMFRKEFECRDISSIQETESVGFRVLEKMLKEAVHGDLLKKASERSDDEKNELRCFSPSFLTAEEWQEDNVENTVANIEF